MEEIGGPSAEKTLFKKLYWTAQGFGVLAVGLILGITFRYLGGVGWGTDLALQFHWHPILMVTGMIFLYGNSILIYRGFRDARKKNLKLVHATINIIAFLCAVIGLVAVFDAHNSANPPKPNLYSLHSWIGLSAVILFAAQYLFGFIFYLYPTMTQSMRVSFMPLHVFFGTFGFVLCVAAALMGLTESVVLGFPDFPNLPAVVQLHNLLGVTIAIFAGLVIFLVTDSRFKRLSLPEENAMLLTGQD